jgi:alanine racemase
MKRREFFELLGVSTGLTFSKLTRKYPLERSRNNRETIGSFDPLIEINLNNIHWNIKKIRKLVKVPIMAVVKANAYGHGLIEVGRFLERKGIEWLMVGKLQEAVVLRKEGVKCSILNFGPFSKEDCEEIIQWEISQSVYTEEARYLNEISSKLNKKARVHIHIDTGLGRIGIPYYKALPFIERISRLPNLIIEGISTTLSEDKEFDLEQLKRFRDVCSLTTKRGISTGLRHAASSDGILSQPQSYLDMVRPGITIYGYYPSLKTQKEDRLSLKPALKMKARVIYMKDLLPGESLSYHRTFIAQKKELIGTVGAGYSDGYPFQLANKGFVLIRDKKFPIIASVTANHLMVNLTNNRNIRIGDEVILINDDKKKGITADEVGELSGISVYKVLIGLNPLLPRKYIEVEK